MKQLPSLATLALLAALSLPAPPALAAYTQEVSTFSAGGGESSSGSYTNLGVIGQPGIVGTSIGGTYTANHGFLAVLGDGFKILYPVISATPGTLSFTLMSGASSGQDVTIGNSGGSNLNWTVTKQTPDSIFQLSQSSGTNSGTVTVTANAVALPAGTYSNTLTVSGAGIDQTVQVALDLNVTPASYTLAVTLKLATPGKGGGTVTSTIPDSRLSCQRTGGSSDVICSANFSPGTITLSQTPDSNTTWATWGAPGCGSNPTCQVALNSYPGSGTDATFPYSSMAKVVSNSYVSDSLVSAYGNAAANDTINARAVTFVEGAAGSLVTLNSGKVINLVSGLDAYYAPTSGFTTLRNILKVRSGRVNIKGGLKIHP